MKSVLAITSQIFTLILHYVNGEEEVTVTTPVFRDEVSMKPTTSFRRIAVDINEGNRLPASDVIFHKIDAKRRKSADIWNWDYWCQLQAQKGNCSKMRQKYYYNSQLDQCSPFTYSGCHGNKNNFDTRIDCERHCKGAAFMAVKNITRSIVCSLQPNAGLCLALFNKFYYDVNEGTCKSFIYGGCGGNDNRFNTKRKCLKKCEHSVKSFEDF